jgi:hypothetical protein
LPRLQEYNKRIVAQMRNLRAALRYGAVLLEPLS